MIALVGGVGLLPAVGTAVGAALGALTSFALGRAWIFRAISEEPARQAQRYALVAIGSLLLNGAGEHVFATVLGFDYIAARVFVAIAVSLGWNFPMQRRFVFHEHPP
jgi:putative flippase GtrA